MNIQRQDQEGEPKQEQPSFEHKQQREIQDSYSGFVQMQKDLQFIQMLAHPDYVIQLHQRGYLYDQKFMNYIEGLKYLNNNQNLMMIKYPEGLLNLQRIKSKGFAEYLKNNQNAQKFKKFCLDRNQKFQNSFS